MTQEGRRKWGRVEPGTFRWWQRYNTLRREGFIHDEAALFAEGVINSQPMRDGRSSRRAWRRDVLKVFPDITEEEYEEVVWDMYMTYDWQTEYSQFYPD